MIYQNRRHLVANGGSVAARGFFGIFYRWGKADFNTGLGLTKGSIKTSHRDSCKKGGQFAAAIRTRHSCQAAPSCLRQKHARSYSSHHGKDTGKDVESKNLSPFKSAVRVASESPERTYSVRIGSSLASPELMDGEKESPPYFHLDSKVLDENTAINYYAPLNESTEATPVHSSTPTKPTPKASPQASLSTSLRQLMRALPHSVVVITTLAARPSGIATVPTSARFQGMTLSSFTTLTLTPKPIITFNIKHPSRTLDALKASRHFLIHILAATKSGQLIADAFTKGEGPHAFKNSHFKYGSTVVPQKDNRNDGDKHIVLPVIKAKGVTSILRCEILHESERMGGGFIRIGDHELVLGSVLEITDVTSSKTMEAVSGLCYAHGQYRMVGSTRLH